MDRPPGRLSVQQNSQHAVSIGLKIFISLSAFEGNTLEAPETSEVQTLLAALLKSHCWIGLGFI